MTSNHQLRYSCRHSCRNGNTNTRPFCTRQINKMLFKRVEVAEAALLNRLDTLRPGPNGKVEREEVEKALDRVRAVKKNVLNYPL